MKTALVSVTIEMLARADAGAIEVSLTRKTRTLIFLRADFKAESSALIASLAPQAAGTSSALVANRIRSLV